MMQQIWKFPIYWQQFSIEMPIGAEILTVQIQNNEAFLWVLVDPKSDKEYRNFEFHRTGDNIHLAHRKYIGTFQLDGSIHLFEIIN